MSTPNKLDERWAAAMPDLAEAARKAGIDPGIMAKIAGFECGYNPGPSYRRADTRGADHHAEAS